MSEKIPPRFRKTKTDKWAVMAPVDDLEKALAEGGKIDVQRRSGEWGSFVVASLGKPFDVDGTMMCYGYGPEDEESADSGSARPQPRQSNPPPPTDHSASAPSRDGSEPLPEYQGGADEEWDGF